jgi:hypothetical protein
MKQNYNEPSIVEAARGGVVRSMNLLLRDAGVADIIGGLTATDATAEF